MPWAKAYSMPKLDHMCHTAWPMLTTDVSVNSPLAVCGTAYSILPIVLGLSQLTVACNRQGALVLRSVKCMSLDAIARKYVEIQAAERVTTPHIWMACAALFADHSVPLCKHGSATLQEIIRAFSTAGDLLSQISDPQGGDKETSEVLATQLLGGIQVWALSDLQLLYMMNLVWTVVTSRVGCNCSHSLILACRGFRANFLR